MRGDKFFDLNAGAKRSRLTYRLGTVFFVLAVLGLLYALLAVWAMAEAVVAP